MELIRLQIENFITHSKSDISFNDFSSALIIGNRAGDLRESNGTGKSTIFSAIKYVLFNQIEFSTLDKIIRHGTEKCVIIFDFRSSLDNQIYRIERSKHIKLGSEVRLFKFINNEFQDLTAATNKETEKEITKLIKVNYKTFCNSVMLSQFDFINGIAAIEPSKKKSLLKEILQLNIYSKYEKLAKTKISELIKNIDKEKVILSTIGNPEEDIKSFILQIKEIEEFLEIKNNILEITKKNYEKELDKYTSSSKKFEELERLATESIAKQKSIENDINKLFSSSQEYQIKIDNINSSGKIIAKEIKKINSELLEISGSEVRSKYQIFLKEELENNTKSIIETKTLLNSFSNKLSELKIPIPQGSVCKHCRQEIDTETRELCQAEIDKSLFEIEQSIKNNRDSLLHLDEKRKTITDEIVLYEKIENKFITNKQLLISKEKEIELKRSLFSEFDNLLTKNTSLIDTKNKELKDLKSQQLTYNREEYNKLKIEISNAKNKVNLLVFEIESLNKMIISSSNNLAILSSKKDQRILDIEKISLIKDKIIKLEKDFITHQQVVKAFGSNGIPALITFNILDDFQNETNVLFSKLCPGLQAKFKAIKDRSDGDKEDTLDIDYILNGYELEYEQLSGAQKIIASICLKFGLAEVLKKKLGVDMKFLFIDEADQSLDEANVESFEDIVKSLQKYYKVLIISHNKDIKDKYSNIISVEQDENLVSTAKLLSNR